MRPSAGDFDFRAAVLRGLRTNWLMVGMQFSLLLIVRNSAACPTHLIGGVAA